MPFESLDDHAKRWERLIARITFCPLCSGRIVDLVSLEGRVAKWICNCGHEWTEEVKG